ncbi:MAG: TetR/AcrR family transcriptional regulator [Actinobacteria bacterium]|nr:TetR/AcrR family transcriptional regulator [Actinomycetota bacterium]
MHQQSDNDAAPGPISGGARPGGRGRGRRAGETATRADILSAARGSFAERGYDRATIRGIAGRAGVDPALVIHYFGSKEALFVEALELPQRPGDVVSGGLAAGREHLGATIVRAFLETWDAPATQAQLTAMLRSALTNDTAMDMVRRLLLREVFGPVTRALGVPDAQLRADLVGTQLLGLAMLRYVARIEPVASAPVDRLVRALGPTLQRYLTEDLAAGDDG